MLVLNLKGLNKAKIWYEENEEIYIDKFDNQTSYEFVCSQQSAYSNYTIILELFLPRGGRIIYGALGFKFKSTFNESLLINIPQTKNDVKVYKNSLISPLEMLKKMHANQQMLFSGELEFFYAAYSEISLSSWIFEKLTYLLINLLKLPKKDTDQEMLINLFNKAL